MPNLELNYANTDYTLIAQEIEGNLDFTDDAAIPSFLADKSGYYVKVSIISDNIQ